MKWVYGKRHPIIKRTAVLTVAFLHFFISTTYAVPQSPNYKMTASSINEGGKARISTGYFMSQDTIADTFINKSQSPGYRFELGFIEVIRTNPPVLFQNIPNQSWLENEPQPDAFDLDDYFESPDSLSLTYSVSGNININVDIDPDTNLVSFSQPDYWSGVEEVIFTATDTEGNSTDSNPVSLTVEGVENSPVLDHIDDITVNETELVHIIPNATDPDGDNITYSFTLPLDSEGKWQTDYDDAGTYVVTVTATDDSPSQLSDFQDVNVTVLNVNRPPVMEEILDVTANEGELVVITPSATDPDGETVTFYYTAPLDSTGKWQTDYDDAGTYTTTVTASDNIDTVSQEVNIIVLNVNRAPIASLTLNSYTVKEGETFTVTVNASDPDADTMTFTLWKDIEEIASGAIIDQYQTTTSISGVGYHEIKATVTDSGGLFTTVTQGIDVVGIETKYKISPLIGDFNGDGLTDLGQYNRENGKWHVGLSSEGEFTYQTEWLSGFGDSNDWVPIGGDFNGDSVSDIGIYNDKTGEIKIATSDKTKFELAGTWATYSGASTDWQSISGNYNGDRFADAGVYNKSTGEWKIALGNGTGFGIFETWLTGFGGTDWTVTGGDFNGDSLGDIGIFHKSTGRWKAAFSDGEKFIDKGEWASGFGSDKSPVTSDFNSDGLTDAGYWDKNTGEWHKAITVGNSFVDKGIWISGFGSTSHEAAFTGDFNGDGINDAAVFDRDADGINKWTVRLSTDRFADLLTEVKNNTGGITTIEYKYAAKDGNPDVPFPVHVVGSVTLTDTLPADQPQESYAQNFSYNNGYYDATDREFRGFGKVTVTDPITSNYTETYYHQGRQGEDGALKGQIDKIFVYDGNGKIISEVFDTYEISQGGSGDNVTSFPKLKEVLSAVYEENGTSVTTKSSFVYDALGNTIKASSEGDITVTGDERYTETDYVSPYLEGYNRPIEVRLKNADDILVNKKNMAYDDKGNLITHADYLDTGDDPVTSYAYDDYGNILTTTNTIGHTLTTVYETTFYSFPETITNELGHTITYTYDYKLSKVLTVTDANNATITTVYDSLGRTTEVRNANNNVVTSYTYPDFNTVLTTKLNLTTEEHVDGIGRKYKTVSSGEDGVNPANVLTGTFYNERGHVSHQSFAHYDNEDPSQISYIRYDYDIRGRAIKVTSDFPGIAKDSYITSSYITPLKTEVTDANGNRKGTVKDIYDNNIEIIEYTQAGTYHTYYEYNIKNNLAKVTDSQGNITTIQYDSLGRKTSMTDPDTGISSYTYDALGNLLTQTDNKDQTITMHYDAISRLTWKEYNDPNTTDVHYYYDEAKPNCVGRLSRITDGAGELSYEYDIKGRVTFTSRTIEGTTYTSSTTYDILDRVTSTTYPDGEVVNYTYDTNSGLLEAVSGNEIYTSDVIYNAKGQMKSISYGNATSTTYSYGQDELLSRIYTSNGTSDLQDLNYTFDKNGNLTTYVDNRTSQIRNYTYDDLNRLTHAEGLPGSISTMDYQYDSIGNMTYKSDVGFMIYGESGAGPHAVTTAGINTYAYDVNGNMISGVGRDMAYDFENRLLSVTKDSTTTDFLYNHSGQRVKKYTDTTSTLYISNTYEIEDNGTETIIRKYVFVGQNRIASVESTGHTYYYHSDHLGSSNIVTDENGTEVQNLEYMPYGQIAVSTGTYDATYKFTGKELDNTGLYYFEARYYDPLLGRFISADPTVQRAYDPQDLNRYTYCRNNPLVLVDPSGYGWFKKFLGKIIGVVAAIIALPFGPQAAMMAYAFTSTAIESYQSGASFAQSIGYAAASMAMAYVGGEIGGAVAGSMGSAIGAGAAGGATGAALMGGDIGRGALAGAAAGAAAGFMGSLGEIGELLSGAVAGGVGAEVGGGTFGAGALKGALDSVACMAATTGDLQRGGDKGQKIAGTEGKIITIKQIKAKFATGRRRAVRGKMLGVQSNKFTGFLDALFTTLGKSTFSSLPNMDFDYAIYDEYATYNAFVEISSSDRTYRVIGKLKIPGTEYWVYSHNEIRTISFYDSCKPKEQIW